MVCRQSFRMRISKRLLLDARDLFTRWRIHGRSTSANQITCILGAHAESSLGIYRTFQCRILVYPRASMAPTVYRVVDKEPSTGNALSNVTRSCLCAFFWATLIGSHM